MSKSTTKPTKPETVEIWTRNEVTYYTELQEHILNGYEVILEGFLAPSNIAGIMTCNLRLKDGQQTA